jgi:hypothetical protein
MEEDWKVGNRLVVSGEHEIGYFVWRGVKKGGKMDKKSQIVRVSETLAGEETRLGRGRD